MQACGYFCDSREAGSLADQNRRFLDYCGSGGFDVSATFFDRQGERAGFLRLISFLNPSEDPTKGAPSPSTHAFMTVVVSSPTVLGAGNEEAAASYYAIRSAGARVIILDGDDGLDAWPPDTGARKDVGKNVRAAMRKRALKGEVLGRPPFGYTSGRSRRLETVESEAAVVRYMFKLYLRENLGVRLIARRLNEENYRTRGGKLWTMVSVRDILRNRAYLGNYQRLGVRVPGSHPKLIAEDEFKRVQERMAQRRSSPSSRAPGRFLLAGLLLCGQCGNHMIGVSRKQSWTRRGDSKPQQVTYRYYHCQSRTNQGICSYHTRRADALEDLVRKALLGESGDEARVQECRAGDETGVWQAAGGEIGRLDRRLRSLDTRMGRVLAQAGRKGPDARVASEVARERLRAEFKRAEVVRRQGEQLSLDERKKALREALTRLANQWPETPASEAEAILRDGVDRITVFDDHIDLALR